jgi:hypothetical protein
MISFYLMDGFECEKRGLNGISQALFEVLPSYAEMQDERCMTVRGVG